MSGVHISAGSIFNDLTPLNLFGSQFNNSSFQYKSNSTLNLIFSSGCLKNSKLFIFKENVVFTRSLKFLTGLIRESYELLFNKWLYKFCSLVIASPKVNRQDVNRLDVNRQDVNRLYVNRLYVNRQDVNRLYVNFIIYFLYFQMFKYV